MRILSITAQKPDSTGSGIYLRELVRAFSEQGIAQAVVAGITPSDTPDLPGDAAFYPVLYDTDTLPFHVAGMSDEMPYPSTRYCDFTGEMELQFETAFHDVISHAVFEFKPDLILCHHLYLLTALTRSWFPDYKIIGICHGSDLRQFQKNMQFRPVISAHIRELDAVCVLHETLKEEIYSTYRIPRDRIHVTGTGYNSKIFYNRNLPADPDHRRLLYAGKLSEKKGVFSLIRSLDYLPYEQNTFSLHLAGGNGSEREMAEIRELCTRSRYPVMLHGPLSQEALASLYNDCSGFAIPSFFDGLPLVLFEALACGIPALCTDLPGIRDWFDAHVPDHGITFVKPPRFCNTDEPNADELSAFEKNLARAIFTMLETPRAKAPDLRSVSWTRIARRYLEIAASDPFTS